MKKLLTIIAAIVVIAGVVEAREIKRMESSLKPMKLRRPPSMQKAEPTDAAVQAYRIVLQRRVAHARAALEQAEAKLLAFEVEAAEREGL